MKEDAHTRCLFSVRACVTRQVRAKAVCTQLQTQIQKSKIFVSPWGKWSRKFRSLFIHLCFIRHTEFYVCCNNGRTRLACHRRYSSAYWHIYDVTTLQSYYFTFSSGRNIHRHEFSSYIFLSRSAYSTCTGTLWDVKSTVTPTLPLCHRRGFTAHLCWCCCC